MSTIATASSQNVRSSDISLRMQQTHVSQSDCFFTPKRTVNSTIYVHNDQDVNSDTAKLSSKCGVALTLKDVIQLGIPLTGMSARRNGRTFMKMPFPSHE